MQSYENVIISAYPSMSIQPNIGEDEFISRIHPSNQISGGMNSSLTVEMTRPIPASPFASLVVQLHALFPPRITYREKRHATSRLVV
jgi:hypothetical protein